MHDQLEALIEWSDQELAAATYLLDGASDRALDVVELARDGGKWVGPHLFHSPAGQLGIELAPDGFDLGKLGHPRSLRGSR